MPADQSTEPALRAEVDELRARLEEAEDMLRAIRGGGVDALVVEGDAGPQLFTLQGLDAEQSRVRGEMLAQVMDAVIATDTEDCVTFLNAAAERQYGVRAGDMLGRQIAEVFTEAWAGTDAEAAMRTALRARGEWRGELIHRTHGGRELHVESAVTMLLDPDGAGTGYVAAIRDISWRTQAEAALRLANQRFDLAVQCSQVVLFQQDLELRYTWLQNPVPGFEDSAAIGKRDADLMERAADAALTEALKREVVASGVSRRQEVLIHVQGVGRHFDLLVEPLRDAAGLISGVTCAAIDITARKAAEEARQESERQYRALAEASSEVAYRMSADWSTMLALDGRQLVMSSDQPLADWAWLDQNLPRDEHPRVRQAISDAIARKTLFELEHRVRRPDGSTGWTLSRAVPILDDHEEVTAWFGAASDITDRKHAEKALAERSELLNGVLEGTTDVIFVKDLDGRVLLANAAFAAAARSTPEQLVGKTDEDWSPPDVAAAMRQQDQAVIAGGSPMQFEDTAPVAGEARVFLSLKAPLRDGDGRVVGILGVSRDITERKQAEDRLRASEARLRRVFESNVVGMIRWDLDSSLILDANAEFLRMTGYVRDDITSGRLNFRDLTPPEWTARNEEGVRAIRATGHAPPYEKEYFHKDGSRLPLIIAGTRFEDSPSEGMSFVIDLTEMKQAEAALRERTALLNGVLESTTDMICVKDLNGRVMLANAAFAAAARSTPEQLVGKTDEDWFPPDVAAAVRQQDVAVIAGGAPMQFEDTLPVAGEARVFLTLKAPLRDGSSRVIGILGISRDITERKRAGEGMARLAAVVESSHDALFGEDRDGIITSWNPGAEQIFGYRADEIVGTSIMRLIPEARQDEEHELQRKLAAGERGGTFEAIRRARDGREFHASITISPLKDAAGKVIGTSRVVRDITERKRAEEALRAGEERMRLATEATEVGIWEWNVLTGSLRWDAQMFQLYGVAPTADGIVSYETWNRAVLPEDRAPLEEELSHTLRRLGTSTREFRILRADNGECRWIQAVETVRASEEDRAARVIGTNLDITEGRRAEEALRNNAVMLADLDRRKDAFLATLSHELRNPLGVIGSSLHLLRLTGHDRDAVQQGCARMQRQVVVLTRLIDDLMDVSRINQDKLTLLTERLDLATVAQSALENSRTVLDQRGHTVAVVLPPQPIEVEGDATRLAQVVSNLLTNAAKYSEPGSAVELTVERQGDEAVVVVRDRGIGLAQADLHRVFELFAQVGGAAYLAQGGLGIGLNLVKRVVELHGGSVEARSEGLGRGSEFLIRLPLPLPSSGALTGRPTERDVLSASPSRPYRILVADDNEDAVTTLAFLLSQLGHDVRTARDGAQAVAVAATFQPEVALLDIGMPELDGHEACRLIRAQPGGDKMLFVALSGWGQDEDKRRARDAGFQHHLVKPVDPVALTAVLQALAST